MWIEAYKLEAVVVQGSRLNNHQRLEIIFFIYVD
jgi:hypothetical protein